MGAGGSARPRPRIRRGHGNRREGCALNRVGRSALVAAAACAALGGCTSSPPAATCENRENQLVSEIDAVGQDLLGGLVYRTSGYSGCEDKGQVDPYVDFVVPRWSSPSEAIARLRERGWELEEVKGGFAPQSTFRSADAQWIAIAYASGADNEVAILVMSRGQFLADVKPAGGRAAEFQGDPSLGLTWAGYGAEVPGDFESNP